MVTCPLTNLPAAEYAYDEESRLSYVRFDDVNRIVYVYDEAGNMERMVTIGATEPDLDSDGDTMADRWELDHFSSLAPMASDDSDEDGYNEAAEHLAGTDPRNSDSYLRIMTVDRDPSTSPLLKWSSVSNRTYTVLQATNISDAFVPITSGVPATPTVNVWTASVDSTISPGFFRLAVDPPAAP